MTPNKTSNSAKALLFARNFFKHPRMLGSVIPSSRFLVKHIARCIDWDRTRVLVEYGPGVGTMTGELLRRLHPDARLVAIEMNGEFHEVLRRSLPDPRLHVVHGSAADVDDVLDKLGLDRADCILSGIPYSIMPTKTRAAILNKSHDALNQRGVFVVYQFTTAVLPYLKQVFGPIRRNFEPRNIPPAQIFVCSRRDAPGAGNGAPREEAARR